MSERHYLGETDKAKERRLREGFFDKYIKGPGIDIGCQNDPVDPEFRKWDFILGDGDATFMEGVEDNTYQTVYCSHIIEHLSEPVLGIRNWYRITAPGGHLIILAPHRDLYEKKKALPSHWNHDHKTMWLPETQEAPDTRSLKDTILEAIPDADIISLRVLDEGWEPRPENVHSCGEYSIEAIIRKHQ